MRLSEITVKERQDDGLAVFRHIVGEPHAVKLPCAVRVILSLYLRTYAIPHLQCPVYFAMIGYEH